VLRTFIIFGDAMLFKKSSLLLASVAACLTSVITTAHAEEKFTYLTNWYAQAEHGGFYQALADGSYKAAGLDVTVKMGGPQVNLVQVMAAGQADCIMGYDNQTMKLREQGINAVTVAASFQKDPQVLIGHPDLKKMEDIKTKTLLLASSSMVVFWPWLKTKYGLQDSQVKPYTFNLQPFIADKNSVQQGYLSSEPYAIEKEAKMKPSMFLLSDYGWPPYSTTIVCMEKTVKERPAAVAAFVKASMQGWKTYLTGDASKANALIKKDNPNMTDDLIANGITLMKSTGMVFGGDAAKMGVGIITDARMKTTYDMLVANKLLDAKVDYKATFTDKFVKDLKILP
jgi:NitT/TauT family transport system substrate-binding protein